MNLALKSHQAEEGIVVEYCNFYLRALLGYYVRGRWDCHLLFWLCFSMQVAMAAVLCAEHFFFGCIYTLSTPIRLDRLLTDMLHV